MYLLVIFFAFVWIFAFLVITPVFMVHLKLHRAHVEDAVAGCFGLPSGLHGFHSDTYVFYCVCVLPGHFVSSCCLTLSCDSGTGQVTTTQIFSAVTFIVAP